MRQHSVSREIYWYMRMVNSGIEADAKDQRHHGI